MDGAKVAFETVRPIVTQKDAELEATLDERWTAPAVTALAWIR